MSRMISELVVDHDRVGLPGVGTFYADVVPSTFSDRGYTINPPYRRLSFLPNAVENDLLVNFYSDVNGIPAEVAREYLTQFLSELAAVLRKRKSIMLPGLGRLRATKENNFFFVPDEKLDIYPEAFGLESVSLKTLPTMDDERVEIPFEFRAVKAKAAAATSAGLTETVDPAKPAQPAEQTTAQPSGQTSTAAVAATETTKPVDQPAAVEASVQDGSAAAQDEPAAEEGEAAETTTEVPEKAEAPEKAGATEKAGAAEAPKANVASEKAEAPEATEAPVATKATEAPEAETAAATENQPKRFRWWIPLLVLLALAAVALVAFLILAHAAPDFIDSILYTPEQLRIINY